MQSPQIQRALISVSDKTGLAEFARGLVAAGVELYSTGGTRRFLEESGVPVLDVTDYTGFPEIMDGRVKTLHPKIHGGILCRHDHPEDREALATHGIRTFELVIVNLYPFEATAARADVSFDEVIEQIDIGGPSLVRGASKNHAFTTIATSPLQYADILEQVARDRCTTPELRRRLAAAAFAHTGAYDTAIASWFAGQLSEERYPQTLRLAFERKCELRYGENPHQSAALYVQPGARGACVATARQLHGKELSYNNLLDLDSALAIVRTLRGAAVVVIKHNNPCGAAEAENISTALQLGWEGDPLSAFGSVLGFNRPVDAASAEYLAEPGRFVEAIVAPDFDPAALEILTTKPKWKANVRLLAVGALDDAPCGLDLRRIQGGLLAQEFDTAADPLAEWKVVTRQAPSDAQQADLRFAWAICRHVKSNAIVLAKNRALIGAGAGQMSRVDSVEIAIKKGAQRTVGSVLASDAFFPFADSIEQAANSGVAAIIQPGGSRNDEEVVAACDRHGIAMLFTGQRHFKH
jgi:phosphoribosylaminoimidazolecarboxamide formyltransferase/IMP cyclohydrolase